MTSASGKIIKLSIVPYRLFEIKFFLKLTRYF